MKEFFLNLWNKESAFRATAVAIGAYVQANPVSFVPDWAGWALIVFGVAIAAGEKNQT